MAKAAQSVLGVLCVAALISLPGMQVSEQAAAEPVLALAAPRPEPALNEGPYSSPEDPSDYYVDRSGNAGRGGDARASAPAPTSTTTSNAQADNGKWLWPTPSKLITSPFGYRSDPFTGGSAFHSGIDFGDGCGTGTGATRPGTVCFAGPAGGYGLRVVVTHENGMSSSYSHLKGIAVQVGEHVDQGQLLGGVGTTGRSTGCHLHFEIMINGAFTDPMPYLQGNPAANPPTFGNGDVGYAPVAESPSASPTPEPSSSTDPCEVSDDPQDAADSGGMIPVGDPAAPGSASPKPCKTPSSSSSSSSSASESTTPSASDSSSTSTAPGSESSNPGGENSSSEPGSPSSQDSSSDTPSSPFSDAPSSEQSSPVPDSSTEQQSDPGTPPAPPVDPVPQVEPPVTSANQGADFAPSSAAFAPDVSEMASTAADFVPASTAVIETVAPSSAQ